jgi:deoxyribose-phosphate aldolase
MRRAELAGFVDHTLLAPEATEAEVAAVAREAVELGTAAVCVSPNRAAAAHAAIAGAGMPVAVVVGFPSGAHRRDLKAAEAAKALEDGGSEIDMVVDLGRISEGRWDDVAAEVATVRERIGSVTLKAILETGLLEPDRIEAACLAAERGGADLVKTSTGFHPAGGASLEAVRAMAAAVGGRLGIKASGGIGEADFAEELIAAGATRLGMSRTARVLDEREESVGSSEALDGR